MKELKNIWILKKNKEESITEKKLKKKINFNKFNNQIKLNK